MKRKVTSILVSLFLILGMVISTGVVGFAAEANEAVNDDKNGVFQVITVYTDKDGKEKILSTGSAFLINETQIITCNHVVALKEELLETIAAGDKELGLAARPIAEVRNSIKYLVSIVGDVKTEAELTNKKSEQLDFAVLTLKDTIKNRKILPIRSSKEDKLESTEDVYALGFPDLVEQFQDYSKYTSEDVTVTSGKVSKIITRDSIQYIQHSAHSTEGNSGGPLVDADGNVVGICGKYTGDGFDKDYFYAVDSDEFIEVLESFAVPYTKAGTTPAAEPEAEEESAEPAAEEEATPEAETPALDKTKLQAAIDTGATKDLTKYSEETQKAYQTALDEAKTVVDSGTTQDEIDAALKKLNDAEIGLVEKKSGLSTGALIGIIAAIAAAAIAIIAVLLAKGKKKPETKAQPVSPIGGTAPQQGSSAFSNATPVQGGFVPPAAGMGYQGKLVAGTSVLEQGGSETTVLNQGGMETTVLTENQHFGVLVRKKSNETIEINKNVFKIGKERANVDYCISDNTAVSRVHITISNKDGESYLVDQRSTNGTFINGARIDAGKTVKLKDRDKITLADEEFEFRTN